MKTLKKYWWVAGLLIALAVALLSPLASPHPDGLERVAEDHGFIDQAKDAPFQIVADYLFPGIQNEAAATITAGVLGTLVMFGVGSGLAWALKRRAASANHDV
jgi:hypothetical protein